MSTSPSKGSEFLSTKNERIFIYERQGKSLINPKKNTIRNAVRILLK